MEYFHPTGIRRSHCGAEWAKAFEFRTSHKSQLTVYRCQVRRGIYNLYSGTIFAARQLRLARVVLPARGVLKGESAASPGGELGMSRATIRGLRHLIRQNAAHMQTEVALNDNVVEADELFQNAGEKGVEHFEANDPPRCRANKSGVVARPPVLGVIGHESGLIRLRMAQDTKSLTLCSFVEHFTQAETLVYTDERQSYNALKRIRETVCHKAGEWARDDDGDGWFETHTNANEGLWTGLRNFLRPFRGVSKHLLHGYVAIHEFRVNLKAISPAFISALIRCRSS